MELTPFTPSSLKIIKYNNAIKNPTIEEQIIFCIILDFFIHINYLPSSVYGIFSNLLPSIFHLFLNIHPHKPSRPVKYKEIPDINNIENHIIYVIQN
mmetsp:Transcript_12359/g.1117  ORF Transcript_12359/g.1117 Transcript_12359/m.1117 type:complete len:97 (+) Transcript_12359:70-360(+)